MNNKNLDECRAKNKATCKKHGWIARPANGKEAREAMVDAQMRVQTTHGRQAFLEAEETAKKAAAVFHSTPEGQEDLKKRIKSFKEKGLPTVNIQTTLAQAKYRRAIEEGNFHIDIVNDKLEQENYPDINSSKGKALLKDLEKISGKDIDESSWGLALMEARANVYEQAKKRYKKSFHNRLAVDLKNYDLKQKQVSRGSNAYYIKNSRGTTIARFSVDKNGEMVEAKVALRANDGSVKNITNGNDFRGWLETQKNAAELPNWAL
jgi:hypothetical protein